MYFKIGVLENLQDSQESTCAGVFIKKETPTMVPANIVEFSRKSFL